MTTMQNIGALLREARAQHKWARPKSWDWAAVSLDCNDRMSVVPTTSMPIPFVPTLNDLSEEWVIVSPKEVIAEIPHDVRI